MPTTLHTFKTSRLPVGFSGKGRVKLYHDYEWEGDARDGTALENGGLVLPQTSDFFVVIDDPHHNNFGTRSFAGVSMTDWEYDHDNGFCTFGCMGAALTWQNVTIPAGSWLQFHYIFFRGQSNRPLNAFAQFKAIENGQAVKTITLAQSRTPVPPSPSGVYTWRAQQPVFFDDPFTGDLSWGVTNGETRRRTAPNVFAANVDTWPSALAIDFIAIVSP